MVEGHLPKDSGLCHLFLMHTTGAITTGELDPGTDQDYLDAFEVIMPKLNYRHPHDPSHVVDHIWSSVIGTSLTLPFNEGKLMLGKWQRVIFIEFYGPKEREIVLFITKTV
jgi:secondary thiamine-phosphate synthase enzyme